jgi:riboflavin kinase/FMN adenylyltransferase
MDVVYFPDDPRPPRWMSPVLALGNFDGLHRGHQKIVEDPPQRRRPAPRRLLLDPHPPRVVRHGAAAACDEKVAALEKAGLHGVAVVRFTEAFSRLSPDQFVRQVLVDWLRVSEVWVGADFLFGHERAGTFSVLRSLGTQYGFRAEKIDPVRYKEFVVSSTRIRRLVAEGRVDEAAPPHTTRSTAPSRPGPAGRTGFLRQPRSTMNSRAAHRGLCHHR